MILHALPDPELTRDSLMDVTTVLWTALEHGLTKTREYFDQEGTQIDPWLAANITRYHARLYLEAQQAGGNYQRVDLLNCGLRLEVVRDGQAFDLWVRKSDDGDLPVPQSDSMKSFYHQPVMLGFYPDGTQVATPTIALVVLWDAPRAYTHITQFQLVCPAQGGETKADVQEHWGIPVPHPVTTFIPEVTEPATEEPATDLPIEPEADEETGEGDDQA